ncbi:MAG: YdbH domain-containing protein [Kiritimatiellaeota bacterium]|nr:YdbH domain-containing protein [Kiritimatiellota bacterium]
MFVFLLVAVNAVILGVVAWNKRIEWATKIARKELDKRGLSDVSFEISELLPDRVSLQNIRVETEAGETLLGVGILCVRFSFPEVLCGVITMVDVDKVDIPVDLDGARVTVPLLERLGPLLEAEGAQEAGEASLDFMVSAVNVSDVNIFLRSGGKSVSTLRIAEARAMMTHRRAGYALNLTVQDGLRSPRVLNVNGEVIPWCGFVQLYGDTQVGDVAWLLDSVQEVMPEEMARLPVAVSNCSAVVRMELNANAWTNIEHFQVTAEFGRGSVVTVPGQDVEVTLQSARLEASGNLTNAQCRVSMGIAGLRSGGDIQVSQEEGRLLSVRGTAAFQESGTNRALRATLDTDLSGRAAAKILPDILPLMPRLLTDGGTLRAEADLAQATGAAEAPWEGAARFVAEARRTSVTLPEGRFAAGRAAVEGRAEIRGGWLGDVRTEVVVEDGMYSSQGNRAHMDFRMTLDASPPYGHATGTFEGRVNANNWLAKSGVRLADTNGIAFKGNATLRDIADVPKWEAVLHVPEFDVMSASGDWHSTVRGGGDIRYSAVETKMDVAVYADKAQWTSPELPGGGCATAGVERASMVIELPPFSTADTSNAVVNVGLAVEGGACKAGDVFEVKDLNAAIPFTWSMAEGIAFPDAPEIAWERMTLDGLGIVPTGFALTNAGGVVDVRAGVRCEGSALNIQASAQVPLDAPGQLTVGLEVPDMALGPEDALAAWLRKIDAETRVKGSLAVRADLRLLGSQPYLLGQLDVSGGSLTRGGLDVSGITVRVPFEAGVEARTVQRPFVAFEAMKMGDIRLDNGRVEFQATPREFFIDRMEADFCKGKLYTYSIHLDPQNPRVEVTVYADRIDLGEMLMVTLPFKADHAEGVLFGRFPVALDNGRVRLKPGYLYSLPGQGGSFRLEDSKPLEALLAQAGIHSDVDRPLAKALSDMDFDAIRVELDTDDDGGAALRLWLQGKSNSKEWPAPVDLNLNVRGSLETVLNMGLKLSQ